MWRLYPPPSRPRLIRKCRAIIDLPGWRAARLSNLRLWRVYLSMAGVGRVVGPVQSRESGLRPVLHAGPTCLLPAAEILPAAFVLLTPASGGERGQGKGAARGAPCLSKSEIERRRIQKWLST